VAIATLCILCGQAIEMPHREHFLQNNFYPDPDQTWMQMDYWIHPDSGRQNGHPKRISVLKSIDFLLGGEHSFRPGLKTRGLETAGSSARFLTMRYFEQGI
jgi:hypothetical protein